MPDLNEMYARWRKAPAGEERQRIEAELLDSIRRQAQAMVGFLLGQIDRQLQDEIAEDAIRGLNVFRDESRFSTYVFAIARNKVAKEIAARQGDRERHVQGIDTRFAELGLSEDDWSSGPFPGYSSLSEEGILFQELLDGLSPEESSLFRALLEGRDQNEIAQLLGITPEAAQTRRRRLRQKLFSKIFRST